MGNCATRVADECTSKGGNIEASNTKVKKEQDQRYSFLNLKDAIHSLEEHIALHGTFTWVVMPIFGVLQAFVPFLQPTCEKGFADITLIFVVLYEAHHIFSERRCWYSTLDLLAPPEIAVLRHVGALKRRRFYFFLGIIESLDLYTDVTFPFVARACDAHLTARWKSSWTLVPVIGKGMESILNHLRFWGFCMVFAFFNVAVSGLWGMFTMVRDFRTAKEEAQKDSRISGETFFRWARSAETAMMPSVAMVNEEIAAQRRYKFDEKADTLLAMQAREHEYYGKVVKGTAVAMESHDAEEEERVIRAARRHYVLLMVVKVLIGNCMMLWLQSSFYAVTYDITGQEAKIKVIVSMIASAVQALIRCKLILPKLGGLGAGLSVVAIFAVAWSAAKVFFTYKCESHMWNISTGCVHLSEKIIQQVEE